MDKSTKIKVLQYGTSFLLGGGLVYIYLSTRDFPTSDAAENYRMLADATTSPGLLFIMVGALVWASSLGAVDGLAYALRRFFRAFVPGGSLKKDETYYDFVQKRREKEKKSAGYGFLFVTGAVFMVASLVFILLFYR